MLPKVLGRTPVKSDTGLSQVIHYQEFRYEDSLKGRKVELGMKFHTDMSGSRLNQLPDGTFQEPNSGRVYTPIS